MNIKNLLFLIVLVFVITNLLFAQSDKQMFRNFSKTFKSYDYLYESLCNNQIVMDFFVDYKQNIKKINRQPIHKIAFGSKSKYEYIGFVGDTIFQFSNFVLEGDSLKKALFILNDCFKDTIYIEKFSSINKHKVVLDKTYYSSSIDDTVFQFKLFYFNNSLISSSEEDNYYYYEKIRISKHYGFLYVNYKYHGADVEIYFNQ